MVISLFQHTNAKNNVIHQTIAVHLILKFFEQLFFFLISQYIYKFYPNTCNGLRLHKHIQSWERQKITYTCKKTLCNTIKILVLPFLQIDAADGRCNLPIIHVHIYGHCRRPMVRPTIVFRPWYREHEWVSVCTVNLEL